MTQKKYAQQRQRQLIKMPKGIKKEKLREVIKKVGVRPKGRTKWNQIRGGVVYLPTYFIGHKVKIIIFEK